jgi:hypothetical protein
MNEMAISTTVDEEDSHKSITRHRRQELTLERRGFLLSIGEVASPPASSGGLITSLSPELSSLPFSPCSSSPWPPKLGIAGFPLAGADPVKDMGVHMYTQ